MSNAPKKEKKVIGFRVDPEILRRIDRLAKDDDRSRSSIVIKALRVALPILESESA